MKTIRLFLISTLLVLTTGILSAQSNEVPVDIITALSKGDAPKLNNYLNTNVELVIGQKNDGA